MKSIFLCEEERNIPWIYGEEQIAVLQEQAGVKRRVYNRAYVVAHPEEFYDTEYIFSSWGLEAMTEEEVAKTFPKAKAIFYAGGGVQFFARPFLNQGIRVFSAWAANAVPVAEFATAQIILANKGFFVSSRLYKTEGNQASGIAFSKCNGNFDETVGIIGAGMIGKGVIKLLRNYRVKCIVWDPFLSEQEAENLGVEKCSLEEVFSRSMTISNHLADNANTRGLLNYELFSRMRENAVFINTGRPLQVVDEDLLRILQERPDITALLDVTHPEPLAKEHPFLRLDNCIVTPHTAGSSGAEVRRMGEYMVAEFLCIMNGEACKYEVTKKMLETMA